MSISQHDLGGVACICKQLAVQTKGFIEMFIDVVFKGFEIHTDTLIFTLIKICFLFDKVIIIILNRLNIIE